jgi:hypothetical protein
MRRRLVLAGTAIGLIAAFGCAKPRVWQPPRIDLRSYGTLGLVEFRSADEHGAEATRQFLTTLHAAQAGVPVLELGALPPLLRSVGHQTLDPEAARAIGERYRVGVLVVGDLQIDEPRPTFSVQSFTQANAGAEIRGSLDARILDARSGATIWSNGARGKRNVAHLNLSAGSRPDFGAVDPKGEHAELIRWLVERVTGDFRGRWVRP